MKKNLFLGLLCALLFSAAAMAQPPRGAAGGRTAEERAQMQTEQMTKTLGLDATQIEPVKAINLKYAQKIDELRTSNQDRAAKAEALKKLDADKNAELQQVLTAEQYAQLQQIQSTRREKAREKMKSRKPRGRGER